MILRLFVLVVSLSPSLVSAGDCLTSALEAGRAKWAAAAISSYQFALWEHQGAWSHDGPVRVTVSKGMLASARYLHYAFRPGAELQFDITERESADVAGRDTIPRLFDLIEKHLQEADVVVTCAFHPDLGFPMIYDYRPTLGSDREYSFSISDFEALEESV